MGDTGETRVWGPVAQTERYRALDVLRGVALLGVLLVNLADDFRVSLAEHILGVPTHRGGLDHAVDVLVAALLEFKAFTLFSLLFGVGLALFLERAASHNVGAARFLLRRLLVLLGIGLCHMLFVWNGDILSLYAVCGLLLLPFLRLPTAGLASVCSAVTLLSFTVPWEGIWPNEEALRGLAAEANQVYSGGTFVDVVSFHCRETRLLILPLLAASLPRTWGLMGLGAAVWRTGAFRERWRHRRLLWAVAIAGGLIGGSATALSVYSASTGGATPFPSVLVEAGSYVPLALAYAAGLLLVLQSAPVALAAAPFASVGQMTLTNYLLQSVALSLIFYGYGLGFYGRLGSAGSLVIGLTVYAVQVTYSRWWLSRYRFGPVEWFWRSMTYGRWQPMRA